MSHFGFVAVIVGSMPEFDIVYNLNNKRVFFLSFQKSFSPLAFLVLFDFQYI